MQTVRIVDETGKKIRGKADGHIKDYDQYGEKIYIINSYNS